MQARIEEWVSTLTLAFSGLVVVYQVFASFSKGFPLKRLVNPHRFVWLGLASTMLVASYVMLLGHALRASRVEAATNPLLVFAELAPLFTPERGDATVSGAFWALMLPGFALLGAVVTCWWMYPSDPSTFGPQSRRCRRGVRQVFWGLLCRMTNRTVGVLLSPLETEMVRAIRHYTSWPGGLVYAALIVVPRDGRPRSAQTLIESQDPRLPEKPNYRLFDYLSRAEYYKPEGSSRDVRRSEAQRKSCLAWLETGLCLYQYSIPQQAKAGDSHLGRVVAELTTFEKGGVMVEYLHPAHPGEPDYILIGVTDDVVEVENGRARSHFEMLRDALRRIVPDKNQLGSVLAPPSRQDAISTLQRASVAAGVEGAPSPAA